ncbi:Putative SAM-dependent methyltransferase [Ignavibacterium album JCM 16511]|uniref:Putative SAM-dependent methyltransferase n=1 Tax=Ignavibacterium album (strain DSM 19864 / JCM 16511 / NBRC 101810 / Mat9-16) TaxID=945713 RepID=I0AN29_IGNAJ|nr:class I SAM-dependent methyltransferase [Ignavibacterium album]AFH50386.1 Putative SAM-dependent methyltransferase [Ignavibacterium album JCM 16511]
MGSVTLKKGKEKIIQSKHPWIFSGAIDKIDDVKENGETVLVKSASGDPLAIGAISLHSQISVRIWSFNCDDKIDKHFFERRILSALELRKKIVDRNSTNVYRLINSENDLLPGLIVDLYGDFVVCQFLSAGAVYWKKEIIDLLADLLKPKGIYERSDSETLNKEKIEKSSGVLFGDSPEALIEVVENDIKFLVDIKSGHKTGFYIDQRDNRNLIKEFVADKSVLNCFCYTGGFSLYAKTAGAKQITNIDSSSDALEVLTKNFQLNNFSTDNIENIEGDVFKLLRKFRDEDRKFDVIILDPPKFAESVSQVSKAARGYKDINLLAMKLLNKGGVLFTFSCSGHITQELFSKIISDAAIDSGRTVKIIKKLTQSSDHPVLSSFPEGLYLKGLVCEVT